MSTRTGPPRSRGPAATGALTAAFFVVLLITQAPHLVHHLFEAEHEQAKCVFAACAERAHAVEPDAVTVAPALPVQVADPVPPEPALPSPAPVSSDARAPPLRAA